jgi:hypothetical protein
MRVTARVKSFDMGPALKKADSTQKRIVTMVTEAAREDTKPYVPYVTGALRGSAETESKPSLGKLVYGSSAVPYARAQYYGLANKSWPGTVMQWFERSKAANKAKWERIAKLEYGRRFDGR